MSQNRIPYADGERTQPPQLDPNEPLPGEIPAGLKAKFMRIALAVGLFGLGTVAGLSVAPEAPSEALERIADLEQQLFLARSRLSEVNRSLAYKNTENTKLDGLLKPKDRKRHIQQGKRYSRELRKVKAQSAAELVDWFIKRWNELLDRPEPDDRRIRRANVLSRLVGAMGRSIDPDDYVGWQAEFLNGSWLGELHFDMDGDGMPGKRSAPNPRDSFADVSVCEIAMAINLSVRDAQILVMPGLRCDSPKAKMSVFLQGSTLDDAITDFVRAVKEEGFLVKERMSKGVRLILLGLGSR